MTTTRNILLVFAVACLIWAPVRVRAAALASATCAAAANGGGIPSQITDLESVGSLNVTCPADAVLKNEGLAADAQPANGPVYPNTAADQTVQLSTLLPGATYTRANNANIFTVSQLPKASTTVYFRCQNEDDQDVCWIGIRVAAQQPLGPQACGIGGSQVDIKITDANQVASFMCAGELDMFPKTATAIFESDCKTETDLNTVIPGAVFTPSNASMNTLAVKALPAAAKELCYVCAVDINGDEASKCKIKINVSGAKGGAMGLTARSASALGALLVGAALTRAT